MNTCSTVVHKWPSLSILHDDGAKSNYHNHHHHCNKWCIPPLQGIHGPGHCPPPPLHPFLGMWLPNTNDFNLFLLRMHVTSSFNYKLKTCGRYRKITCTFTSLMHDPFEPVIYASVLVRFPSRFEQAEKSKPLDCTPKAEPGQYLRSCVMLHL